MAEREGCEYSLRLSVFICVENPKSPVASGAQRFTDGLVRKDERMTRRNLRRAGTKVLMIFVNELDFATRHEA